MDSYQNDFGPFEDHVWLNTASEGALPKVAVTALQEVVEWKVKPYHLTHRRFQEIPQKLKQAAGGMLNVPAEEIILGNSATYGIHLLANGLPLAAGDEVILMQNDFPTSILPWLGLQEKGVVVKQVPPKDHVLTLEELQKSTTAKTKVVCLSHVHSFSGHRIDLQAIGEFCRAKKIIFVANCAQSLGTEPLDFSKLPVDAMTTAGFKWLCGPYGTGFCWMKPALREKLKYNHAFWVNVLKPEEIQSTGPLNPKLKNTSTTFDVFGTANFFNFAPLATSLAYLLKIGLEKIRRHNDGLIEQLIQGLDPQKYNLVSPAEAMQRTNLLVFSHKNRSQNSEIFSSLLNRKIYLALWKGNLRVSPHIFNTPTQIEQLLTVLNTL